MMILQGCDYLSITRRGGTSDPRPLICSSLASLYEKNGKYLGNLPPSSSLILTIMHVQTMGWRNEDQLGDYGIIAAMVVGRLFLPGRVELRFIKRRAGKLLC